MDGLKDAPNNGASPQRSNIYLDCIWILYHFAMSQKVDRGVELGRDCFQNG